MSLELRQRLFEQLDSLTLIDPHTHINPLAPASETLADILGYHYYTELAHSAGMPKAQIEEPDLPADEKVRRLIQNLGPISNTIQYSWLVEMCQQLFGFEEPEISSANWQKLYEAAAGRMGQSDWPQQVLKRSKLAAVFLTNDFDDSLSGFDTSVYIPCLRTDDLVFHLAKPEVRQRLERATGIAPRDARSVKRAIAQLFHHFKSNNARACAISLPPDFTPQRVSLARANTALAAIHSDDAAAAESHRRAIANFVFWTLAEMAEAFKLPFDLMIGVNRGVYEAGVHQGRDLYDSRVSLVQYKELFNAFPGVTFPVSVLASVTNQELTSYAWIFPNVVTNGHWWYSNTPTFIEHDLAARLEAVPRTKQIGYYSDMYKLEFALPKFAMYKRILAKVLAERFVIDRGWSESQAVELGTQLLRGNVESIFRWGEDTRGELPDEAAFDPLPTTAAAFAAPVTDPVWEGTSLIPEQADGRSPIGESPLTQSVFGTSALNPPAGALRAPDEAIVVPVPTEPETPRESAVVDDLDDGVFDLEEGISGSTSASAAGIGAGQTPELDLANEEPLELFDAEQVAEVAANEPADDEVEALTLEDFDEGDEVGLEGGDQTGQVTEPFPFKLKEPSKPKEPPKSSQDQWGFLGGK